MNFFYINRVDDSSGTNSSVLIDEIIFMAKLESVYWRKWEDVSKCENYSTIRQNK